MGRQMELNSVIQEPVALVESLKTHFREKTTHLLPGIFNIFVDLSDFPIKTGTIISSKIQ